MLLVVHPTSLLADSSFYANATFPIELKNNSLENLASKQKTFPDC